MRSGKYQPKQMNISRENIVRMTRLAENEWQMKVPQNTSAWQDKDIFNYDIMSRMYREKNGSKQALGWGEIVDISFRLVHPVRKSG